MVWVFLTLLAILSPFQTYASESLEQEGCALYDEIPNLMRCVGPKSAEELDAWANAAAEKYKRSLSSVTEIWLRYVDPSVFQSGLSFLPNLNSLTLESPPVSVIRAETFAKLPQLEELKIIVRRYTELDDKALVGLPKLRKLNIAASAVMNLKNLLKEVPTLDVLRINSNFRIETLQQGDLDGIPNLKELYIVYTSISKIESGALKNLRELEVLHVTANEKLNKLEERNFVGLPVKKLILGSNTFSATPIFSGLESLEDLDLSYGNIETVKNEAFKELKKLRNIDLSYNKIRDISADAFEDLPALENVDLTGNKFEANDSALVQLRNRNVVKF